MTLDSTARPRRWMVPLAAGALAALVGLLLAAYTLGRSSNRTSPAPVNADLSLAPAESLGPHSLFDRPARPTFAVTADGSRIVFAAVAGATEARGGGADARRHHAAPAD